MKRPLNVFHEGNKVGDLKKNSDDTLTFCYSKDWLDHTHSFALTPALPLQEEPFNNRLSKSYFDNLLPEGDTLKTFEIILKKSFEDPYQLLESYGLDCAGALEITPLDSLPPTPTKKKLEPLSFTEIDQVIEKRESLYVHAITQHKGRFSLAGAQDKIPVIYKEGQILLPQDNSPTTHILKPPNRIAGVFETVYNEYLCMQIASLVGLEVPEVQLIGEENKLFLISRYDRKVSKGKTQRIHQFDLCQAQGYPASEKYEDDGGPTFSQNYQTIQQISDSKLADLQQTLRWLSFNLIIGNNDSHSKNLSFIYDDKETKLAPLYDLMSTAIYENMTSQFAFSLGGQREWHKLKKAHFVKVAHQLGFAKREDIVTETLIEECQKVAKVALPYLDKFITDNRSSLVAKKLRVEIEKRTKEFLRMLDGKK